MLPLIITPKADNDTDTFFLYIAQDSQESAFEFLERLEETYVIRLPSFSSGQFAQEACQL